MDRASSRTGHDGGQLRALDLLAVLLWLPGGGRDGGFGGGRLVLARSNDRGARPIAVGGHRRVESPWGGADANGARGSDDGDDACPRRGSRAASRDDGGVVEDDGGHLAVGCAARVLKWVTSTPWRKYVANVAKTRPGRGAFFSFSSLPPPATIERAESGLSRTPVPP